jgi:hypothetical protein
MHNAPLITKGPFEQMTGLDRSIKLYSSKRDSQPTVDDSIIDGILSECRKLLHDQEKVLAVISSRRNMQSRPVLPSQWQHVSLKDVRSTKIHSCVLIVCTCHLSQLHPSSINCRLVCRSLVKAKSFQTCHRMPLMRCAQFVQFCMAVQRCSVYCLSPEHK